MTQARVIVLRDFGFLEIEELELPEPGAHQLEVEVLSAGIQRAQLQLVQDAGGPGLDAIVPGLEAVGRVTAAGARVSRARVGDLVVVGPTPVRGADRPLSRPEIRFEDGGCQDDRSISAWSTNLVIDEQLAVVVPGGSLDPERLALLGDTAVGATAAVVRGARVQPGQRVAVFGCGGAGLATVAALKAVGAGDIVAVGVPEGLEMARTLGATELLGAAAEISPGSLDHLIECPGEYPGEAPSPALLRAGGTSWLVGGAETPEQRAALDALAAERGFQTIAADPDADIGLLLEWMQAEVFDPGKLVRKRYTIEQVNEAVMSLEADPVAGHLLLILEPLR